MENLENQLLCSTQAGDLINNIQSRQESLLNLPQKVFPASTEMDSSTTTETRLPNTMFF